MRSLGKKMFTAIGAVEDDWPMYSANPDDYVFGEPVGYGATSVVYSATYKNQVVAVKVMEIDNIAMMQREVKCVQFDAAEASSRTDSIACTPLVTSVEYGFQDGMDEVTCATILKQAAEGMQYLHVNGWLHRDIKAGNLLVDTDGTVLISDFGCSFQVADRDMRKSFVGTPCWMAPEVVEQRPYDSRADIWSFGITAIELATGKAPGSLYTPAQILLKTVAENAPTLDIHAQAHPFSKTFKDMIDACLQKEPSRRPASDKLLNHAFFKQAKKKQYLVNTILADLPPVQTRQTRRARQLSGKLSTRANMSVWDFSNSPIVDQFRDFSMNAPPSTVATPVHSRFPSDAFGPTDAIDEDKDAVAPLSPRNRKRASLSVLHRRSVSFKDIPEVLPENADANDPA
ncbi:hypothetical protein EMMF5_002872 [Cystobasidiomycetes sp. EMM_F5]